MFNSALTSNPNGNNSKLGVHYCGRFYPAVQDKATGNFVVYINGVRKEFTFIELLNIQQAEQNRIETRERVNKGFEEQKAQSDKWMEFYKDAKEKALNALNKIYTPMKEQAAEKAYKEELVYKDAERRYNQIMGTTKNNDMSELGASEKVHAKEYSIAMTTAKKEKDKEDGIRTFARIKEISFEGQYFSACRSFIDEVLHRGEIEMQQTLLG